MWKSILKKWATQYILWCVQLAQEIFKMLEKYPDVKDSCMSWSRDLASQLKGKQVLETLL